ncbi:efflux RND transporter periplasmic adaptor subunit [Aestuariivirga sp.]|uniref:efflux RND transporter periplasmic adaptor subunit n=1 Tax=Aestuariivirga sp. TaxID=2650926 RepID=UPI00301854C1
MAISARNAGLAVALLLSASLALAGCDNGAPQQAAAPATVPAVTVVKVVSKDLRPSVSFSARVEALHKVDLLARIQGYLDKQNFAEGASVKAGDLLYVIEQAPYQASVAAAEASVAVAAARLDRTEIELKRQTTLVSKEASAQTKLDDARTARNEAKGQYDKLMAELDQAKLQLSYTEIKAPIDGRIGKSLLSVGSFVSPQSGTLATIVEQNPIGVTFPVSQRDIMAVREKMGADAKLQDRIVYIELGKGKRYPEPGKVDFLDVGVNTGTDAVNVRAVFPNPQGLLVDGQLVTAVVEADTSEPTLVVPVNAIQIDQSGAFVLIVNSEKKIEVRRVELLRQDAGDVAIAKGLSAGDLVVTEGVQKVRPGQVVDATEVKPEA